MNAALNSAGGAQPAPLLTSTVFGALMVLSAGWPAGPAGLAAVALAAVAVLASLVFRWAATAAVLLTVIAGALTDPPVLFAAVSGVCAAAYLVIRHAAGRQAVTMTIPTVVGLLGFTVIGLAAVVVPFSLDWTPLLGPALMVAILAVVAIPLTGAGIAALGADSEPPG